MPSGFDGFEPNDGNGDDIEIDVCLGCGRYFEWTPQQAELSRERFGSAAPLEQQCIPCLRFVSPPHEY